MHETALEFGKAFFDAYLPTGDGVILDVGSHDVNGSLRSCAPRRATYIGIDMVAGAGVDLQLDDPHVFPFPDQHFDAVVASSCFEHDSMFWITFLEIVRVTRSGGHIYINVPSNGWYHRHPRDCWRFYPDAGISLQDWARREGYDVTLIESFVGRRKRNIWNDTVMVFRRGPEAATSGCISDRYPEAMNLRRGNDELVNHAMGTEDQQIIQKLGRDVALRDRQITELSKLIETYEAAFEMLSQCPDAVAQAASAEGGAATGDLAG